MHIYFGFDVQLSFIADIWIIIIRSIQINLVSICFNYIIV